MIDAFKRASARRITAVIPYFGYARQDRKDKPRVPISSKLVSDLLVASGTHRLLTMDLHAPQIQGFFSIPVDHLFAAPVLVEYFQKLNLPNLTVVSPDAGGVERARAFAKRLNAELAMVNKRRLEANVAQVMNVIGDVEGQTCLVVDDIIDTAGTLVKTVEALQGQGRSQGLCVLHASGAFGAGCRAHREFAAGGSRRDEHDSACTRSGSAKRFGRSAWASCWRKPSSRFTMRHPLVFCLFRRLELVMAEIVVRCARAATDRGKNAARRLRARE